MRVTLLCKGAIALVFIGLLLGCTNAKADSSVEVTISNATFIGNDTCIPGPCSEVFNAQYQLDVTTNQVVSGSVSYQGTGTLGTLSLVHLFAGTTSGVCSDGPCPIFVGNLNPAYVWLTWDNPTTAYPAIGTYSILQLFMTCEAADSCPNQFSQDTVASSGTITVGAVPEPSSLFLFSSGLVGLVGFARGRQGRRKA